mmetsp:Transcript_126088/g.306371  ORF Transcript_126088/g.306371 Transcript_126088/m.306371 type:complete len:235 (-) Transcript_126088:356-1060(-)
MSAVRLRPVLEVRLRPASELRHPGEHLRMVLELPSSGQRLIAHLCAMVHPSTCHPTGASRVVQQIRVRPVGQDPGEGSDGLLLSIPLRLPCCKCLGRHPLWTHCEKVGVQSPAGATCPTSGAAAASVIHTCAAATDEYPPSVLFLHEGKHRAFVVDEHVWVNSDHPIVALEPATCKCDMCSLHCPCLITWVVSEVDRLDPARPCVQQLAEDHLRGISDAAVADIQYDVRSGQMR